MLKAALFLFSLLANTNIHAEINPQYLETIEISNGHNHVCARTLKGIKCFGNEEAVTTRVPASLKNPRFLETGNRFSCAIVDDGIRCWGEIPNSSKTEMLITQNTLPKPKLLSVGYDHACAVSYNDKIKCWGRNDYNESTPPKNLKNYTELSLGMNNSCAIADGLLVCWGLTLAGSTEAPANLINPRNLTSGLWHHCVQTDEGLKCWGNPYKDFVLPDDPNITGFTSGGLFNCGIVAEGVKCWDEKGKTRLIEGSQSADKLSVGSSTACAVTPETGVICWKLSGKDAFKLMVSYVPTGGISQIENLSAGHSSTCAYGDGGKLKCWGNNFENALNVPSDLPGPLSQLSVGAHKTCAIKDSALSCWGNPSSAYDVPTQLGNVTMVSSGGNHVCAGSNEKVSCWGENLRGALNVPKGLANFSQLSSGMLHSCAVANNEVACWGGEGLIRNINPLVKIVDPTGICTGATFSCGISDKGKVQCWGEQIPFSFAGIQKSDTDRVLKVPEDIAGAVEISCGVSHGCAIYGGKVKCWGSGAAASAPTIKNPRKLASGWFHSCAVGDKGLVCWGKMNGMEMPNYSLTK